MNDLGKLDLWFVAAAVMMFAAVCCFGGEPAIPAFAAALADQDWASRGRNPLIYYLWSPTGSDQEYNSASAVLNFVVNQGSSDYVPERVSGGALIPFDLEQLVDNTRQIERLQYLMSIVPSPAFYETIHIPESVNGKERKAAYTLFKPAQHTGDAGANVGLRIFRLPQFVKVLGSSIDDGLYYKFRGLEVGKTTLDDYLESRGFSRKESKASNAIDELLMKSLVTGSVRAVFLLQGRKTKSSVGKSLASITGDVFAGPLDPRKNVFKSVFNEEFDAFEVIVTLPGGHQEFTIWNGKGVLIAETDPRVVSDHTVPPPFPNRLFAGASCIGCHSERDGYQQLANEQRMIVQRDGRLTNEQGTITFNADVTKFFNDPIEAKRVVLSRFGARQHDIDGSIVEAREALNRRFDVINAPRRSVEIVDLLKGAHSCRQAYLDFTAVYNSQAYRWVTPKMACEELGFEGSGSTRVTLQRIVPPPDKKGYIAEGSANTLGQLLAGNSVTRDDFDQAFPELELKAVEELRRASVSKRPKFAIERKVDQP